MYRLTHIYTYSVSSDFSLPRATTAEVANSSVLSGDSAATALETSWFWWFNLPNWMLSSHDFQGFPSLKVQPASHVTLFKFICSDWHDEKNYQKTHTSEIMPHTSLLSWVSSKMLLHIQLQGSF